MWEHQGKCPCGKRSYLFVQCPKCLKEDFDLQTAEVAEEEYEPPKEDEPAVLDLIEQPAASSQRRHNRIYTLPDVLQTPEVRCGRHTRHVEFLTDATISLIVRDGGKSRKGPTEVGIWKPGRSFKLPNRATKDRGGFLLGSPL